MFRYYKLYGIFFVLTMYEYPSIILLKMQYNRKIKEEGGFFMACKNCKYFDENDTSGGKGYCEWYRTYYWPDDNCSQFTQQYSGGGCFLTSACCNYKGFSDDCKELTVLRQFRDNYLKQQDSGEALINEYYAIAPIIVAKIDDCDKKDAIYAYIYETITKCVETYENEEYEKVMHLYIQMVNELKGKFLTLED